MRERITISIQKDSLDKLDRQIDGHKIRNRSHAIEYLINDTYGINDIKNAVILGGGKQALKLIPLIEDSLNQLSLYGLTTAYLAVGFLGPKIKDYFGDGTKFGLKIIYLEGGEGTAGALKPLSKIFKESFLVYNLLENIEIDIHKFADFHQKHGVLATIATTNLSNLRGVYLFETEIFKTIPEGFSMLETDIFPKLLADNKILTFPIIQK